jgi:hypothetical protein
MYTPITKRVKVAQHKSSIAKQTTETAQTADPSGNLQSTTGTGEPGKDIVTPAEDKCKTDSSGKIIDTRKSCVQLSKMSQEEIEASEIKQGLRKSGDPSANFESKPVMQDAQAASRIDLMGPQELRGNTRAGKIAARNVKKASKQYDRMHKKFKAGKINQTVLDAYKNELDNTVKRSENIGQQAKGMRNRYLSQTMDYDRDLTKGREAGPVKAPEGTQTEDEFKSKFKKELGVTSDSTAPQTIKTPTSSFSAMASQNGVSYKPITLDNGALFQSLDSSIEGFGLGLGKKGGVGKMKSGAFKMKGYGSKK